MHEPDEVKRNGLLTFVTVGGGSTEIEFSGSLAELVNSPLAKDYPSLDFKKVRILIVEATGSLLPTLPVRLQKYTLRSSQENGC